MSSLVKTIFDPTLSDPVLPDVGLTRGGALQLFQFFKHCPVFKWCHANNDCEDRANAISILLDEWKLPNYKAWVFSGAFMGKDTGSLFNYWNYHVAAAIPVKENNSIVLYVIDPATSETLETLEHWATMVTENAYSHHLVKSGLTYIFPPGRIEKDNWYKRNRQNYKWTIQGLSGINGVSPKGKAQLCFNKSRIKKTEQQLKSLARNKPEFLKEIELGFKI
ncbi:MAG TPA: protein-glutamine glutaminase family protein [Flavisolibacter sp.]|nr:protein-glutamine glutaminase family protein [Flavisolibacter sp.]